ncbi:sulfotransferase family cytosolic 1B member 1 [Biomphalaria pfeifferi]|uniref:Sulfotransferase family cytosolic 1B member 1 n=1 Tax=Biomphalaria pfeifferi TaxID=112525 RepID=A0AAD8B1E5_BIOPF|nr:sulfotransferase family cytosolic 1B member 1 [Biomphalaria pfeifferi]
MAATSDMELEHVKDKGGATLTLQVINGRYYPTFPADVIKNIGTLKIREDDVILAGYLKAGTHWVWEILRMLLAGTTDVPLQEKDMGMMEFMEQGILDELPSPRVLNTHILFELLPAEVLTKKPKIVYLTRNPKDTAVSMYHHNKKLWSYYQYDGQFGDYLHLFLDGKVDYGSWFEHISSWSAAVKEHPELRIKGVNYEELSQNPQQTILEMAQFLNLTPSEDLIRQICQACHIDTMREKKAQFDLDSEGQAIMYRKGLVGDWKNYFNNELNTLFDDVYHKKMSAIDTSFKWHF